MDGLSCLENCLSRVVWHYYDKQYNKERANATIRALELGAFDFVTKSDNIFDMSSMTNIKK